MKIFYIYTALLTVGGADRVITNKANWLAEHGYDVTIVTDSQMGRPPVFPLSPKVRLHDFGINFGLEYGHILPVRIYWYFKLMRKYKKMMSSFLCTECPDIVITTLGRDLDFLTSIHDGSVKIGESHIARDYSRNFHLLKQRGGIYKLMAKYGRWKQERTVSRLDGLVLLTQMDEKNWQGVTQTFVIPNSITFKSEKVSSCLNKKAICVGRYNEQKGYEYMVEAWSIVNMKHPDWTLHAYGAGELKADIQQQIDKAGLNGKMILHDPVPNISEKYVDSSIYIMSSRFEGFGMVLVEAMECGLPCVSFDCPYGASDIICNGEDGYIVDYLNSQQLAFRICDLIEDDNKRITMGRKAKRNIQRYNQEAVMKQWVDLFNCLTVKEA
jgi:glycosyltransferase involved in cell wall biosynthesis